MREDKLKKEKKLALKSPSRPANETLEAEDELNAAFDFGNGRVRLSGRGVVTLEILEEWSDWLRQGGKNEKAGKGK